MEVGSSPIIRKIKIKFLGLQKESDIGFKIFRLKKKKFKKR